MSSLAMLRGSAPIVLVAPHAGRRDAARRPWGSAPLRMNDLHTGALTRELAARLDASALINDGGDRNDVDLNRIGAVHDRAPAFLGALTDLVEEGLGRHPRLCILTVHGWNVVQPAVDIGIGVHPSPATLEGGGESAMSADFAATRLPRLVAGLTAGGITATPGLRYPARARENLLQVFTTRYRDDPRASVRRLARHADRVDALQLEVSLALRLPGPWRDAFLTACAGALGPDDGSRDVALEAAWHERSAPASEPIALEFVAPGLCGLAALDPQGGRLLLFLDDGRLVTFTGERAGRQDRDRVAGLRIATLESGEVALSYDGPMLVFPDTTPFVDLECGLARAHAESATVELRLTPAHGGAPGPCPFGIVAGHARLGTTTHRIDGHGVQTRRESGLGMRPRAALRLADGAVIVARGDDGFVCRDGRHVALRRCAIRYGDRSTSVTLETEDGGSLAIEGAIVHRLPVVPGVPGATRLVFAACRHDGRLAGWIATASD